MYMYNTCNYITCAHVNMYNNLHLQLLQPVHVEYFTCDVMCLACMVPYSHACASHYAMFIHDRNANYSCIVYDLAMWRLWS